MSRMRWIAAFFLAGLTGLAQPVEPAPPSKLIGPWQAIPLVNRGRIDAIASLGEGVVICGTRRPTPGHLFRSEDHGITWVDLGNITGQGITCVAAGQGANAYALTEQSEFWVSRDSVLLARSRARRASICTRTRTKSS